MSTSRRALSCTARIQNILDEDLETNVPYFPSEILVPKLEANETKLRVCAIDDYYGIVGINQKDFPTKLQSRVEKPPFLFPFDSTRTRGNKHASQRETMRSA
ncbi:unnamed protein product [Ilex paraguariensis]|uniref:Uncharacterized protein n=1 Tax=Ilex paraguariensis TaxID=185542 RepID=A0ABC8UY17_9AQUA